MTKGTHAQTISTLNRPVGKARPHIAGYKVPRELHIDTTVNSGKRGGECDIDDDNDRIPDAHDPFPLDTDNDGDDNSTDNDDDGDGLSDVEEPIWGTDPLNPNTDGDGDTFTIAASEAECATEETRDIWPADDLTEAYAYDILLSMNIPNTFSHPAIAYTDGDGVNDLDEVRMQLFDAEGNATNIFVCSGLGTNYNDSDNDGWCDGDGYPNNWNVSCNHDCQQNSGLSLDNYPDNASQH